MTPKIKNCDRTCLDLNWNTGCKRNKLSPTTRAASHLQFWNGERRSQDTDAYPLPPVLLAQRHEHKQEARQNQPCKQAKKAQQRSNGTNGSQSSERKVEWAGQKLPKNLQTCKVGVEDGRSVSRAPSGFGKKPLVFLSFFWCGQKKRSCKQDVEATRNEITQTLGESNYLRKCLPEKSSTKQSLFLSAAVLDLALSWGAGRGRQLSEAPRP